MANYFHGNPSEIGGGADGLQTLILMNPAYVGYADNQNHNQPLPPQSSNFVFLNNNNNNAHAPPSQTQHFVGVPLHGGNSPSSASPHNHQGVSALHHGFLHPRAHNYGLYNFPTDLGAAREVTRAQQGLSLSLSSSQPPPPGYGSFCRNERQEVGMAVSPGRGDDVRVSVGSPASGVTNGVNGVQSVLLSSKYLKAAQDLLDEVVNVGRGAKSAAAGAESSRGQAKNIGDTSAASGDGHSGGESSGKRGAAELTTAERQEIQMKKAKLVNMLDEVEQRYMQYHHQMQIVISWFEQAAGVGSAKTYTALALQTISKQFRCLKDAILAQIRAASRNLGEDETNLQDGKIEGSRLKYVDNQIRQQRALQQLGMIQHNAWRPQRGLPERSVSVLRAWLFEHFLHPYPKDSDKLMLAKQTGLTRSQVSNWFINARVRLWKPMVEEMYTEEMKEHDKNGSEDNNNNNRNSKTEHNEDSTSKSTAFHQAKSANTEHQNKPNMIISMSTNSASPTGPTASTIRHSSPGFNMSSEIESLTHDTNSPKKLRISDMLHGYDRQGGKDGFTLMGAPTNFIGGFGSYPMGELGRFGADQFPYSSGSSSNNNGVSLTLGLPHCDNNLGAHQSFLANQGMQQLGRGIGETGSFGGMSTHQTNAHPSNVYENISIPDRKRFAAQLLPDFVA